GNDIEVRYQNEVGDCESKWEREYGDVWRQHGCLGRNRLVVADPKALRHILHAPGYYFDKPKDVIELTLGRGLAWVEGETHRRQREIMKPFKFSAPQMRAFRPVIENSPSKLAQIWRGEVIAADSSGQPVVNVVEWVSPIIILDLVGFGFQFGTLDGLESSLHEQNEKLSLGDNSIFKGRFGTRFQGLIQYMPTSRYRRFRRYSAFMRDFSRGIIEKSMIECDGKDVVSVLLRENASEDPRGSVFDIEMVDQITSIGRSQRVVVYLLTIDGTLLFAGHVRPGVVFL
ncbi:cytochrome P450, partial [Lactarius hatsudake]